MRNTKLTVFIRAFQSNRTNKRKRVRDEEKAHTIIETEKSHDLPSTSCKLRKFSDIIPV